MLPFRFFGQAASRLIRQPVTSLWKNPTQYARFYAADEDLKEMVSDMKYLRNIGISAHIDSGKTTLTERILFYSGRINHMHEVRGNDGVGATMDHMDLEREKGITIQSAATFLKWKDHRVNIIDTPGHVDFTIEVERALRVLDGAVLVLCGVGGVQSQTMTVDRQMRRYGVPRLVFINKLDRQGANPWRGLEQIKKKLRLNVAALQVPIGSDDKFQGLVDLVKMKAFYFHGSNGENIVEEEIPEAMMEESKRRRHDLIQQLAEVDEQIADIFLAEEEPSVEDLKAGIRRATISLKFIPVLMGSAYKNKGVQLLLDGVLDYLPNPTEKMNQALDQSNEAAPVTLSSNHDDPFVGLAFKLEENKFGQLTYMRIYQGTLRKGDYFYNINSGSRKMKIPRLVRMHSNHMEDINYSGAGDICAVFGVECNTGDTFTDGTVKYTMTSMHVPDPVISLSIKPANKKSENNFSKGLQKFTREDPTFRVHNDPESNQTIISGMGELHLEIYAERLKREFDCVTELGKPQVAFRETITQKTEFDYLHKKQSGGQGQYGRVKGYIEPLPEDAPEPFEFDNAIIGNSIPSNYIPGIEKGFKEAILKGNLIGAGVTGVRVVLTDGAFHAVDSSELAFKLAALYAFRQCYPTARPIVLEPVMKVAIQAPVEFQGTVVGAVNKRKGIIVSTETPDEYFALEVDVPLNNMFGFSTELRSLTQGKGEFQMEFKQYSAVAKDVEKQLMDEYAKKDRK
eukprot:TRINITY_DN761_c0_g1_i1.p1 TRINITY_DN761_c0_g1~~TRINITY_DN761_c0_g1_i1.p1  ORF type:complete len:739 (-),score=181.82 TRINITY_DN761_c0_g1_i1:299-2515(-)